MWCAFSRLPRAASAGQGRSRSTGFRCINGTLFSFSAPRRFLSVFYHCRYLLPIGRLSASKAHLQSRRPRCIAVDVNSRFHGQSSCQDSSQVSVKADFAGEAHAADVPNQDVVLSLLPSVRMSPAVAGNMRFLSICKTHSYLISTKAGDASTLPEESGSTVTQESLCREALQDPVAFWKNQSVRIHWFSRYKSVFDETRAPFCRWFPGGTLNACYEAVDAHVLAGKGEKCAIVYDSPTTGVKHMITYNELLDKVRAFAAALSRRGVEAGDRVLIYMPLMPEAAIAMLACARIGAIHVVTFGGFGRAELALRIDHAKPKAIVAASCGIEPHRIVPYKAGLEQALQLAKHKPDFKVLLQRPQYICADLILGDVDWNTFLAEGITNGHLHERPLKQLSECSTADVVTNGLRGKGAPSVASDGVISLRGAREAVPVESDHPLYILYTSGTTGNPKGIVRDHVGQCVSSLYAGGAVYGITSKDTVFCASDLGWVLGHTVMIYGALINGAATVLFEGKPTMTPDAGAFWRVVSEYGVTKLFVAPSAVRAIREEDPAGNSLLDKNLETLETVYLAGEKADRSLMRWLAEMLQRGNNVAKSPHVTYPLVVDNWWQTETGWPVTSIMTGYPLKPENFLRGREGSCGKPCPGWDVRILNSDGAEVEPNVSGHIVLKLPLPPGAMRTLYKNDERYVTSYLTRFPGFYDTGDSGCFDKDGYLYIEGRTDDVLNVAAHRLSSLAIEEELVRHPAVAAAAVVAVDDCVKGQVPVGVVVPRWTAVNRGIHGAVGGHVTENSCSTVRQDASTTDMLKSGTSNEAGTEPAGKKDGAQQTQAGEAYRLRPLTDAGRDLVKELVKNVRENIGPYACFKTCVIVSSLPHTRSGKILRKTIASILQGRKYAVPATIEDARALTELERAVKEQTGITMFERGFAYPMWANGLPKV